MALEPAQSDVSGDTTLVVEPDVDPAPLGRFHTWWRGDPLPTLPTLSGLSIERSGEERLICALSGLNTREFRRRVRQGHQPWLARIAGEPVGWGWCASEEVSIGELGITRTIPPGNRYLWDFVTVPPWRGRCIYPWLLQTIVAREPDVDRFWVGHDFSNTASARGIAKAGFHEVGVLYRRLGGGFEFAPTGAPDRALAASALFGVSIADLLCAGPT